MMPLSPDKSTRPPSLATPRPGFVRDVVRPGPTGIADYWTPERSGQPDTDRRRGADYFREAVEFSLASGDELFLPRVLLAMPANIGWVEGGFIDALLSSARHAHLADELELDHPDEDLRMGERLMRETIETSKSWGGPELLYLHAVSCLTGREGPTLAGSVSFLARTALNGAGH